MRSGTYLRRSKSKSADEKSSAFDTRSVEDQRKRASALEKSNGYAHTREFVDDGKSAFKEDVHRPAFEALCNAVTNGELDVVIADAPDRLTRQGGEAYLAFRRMCGEFGVKIHTVSNGLDNPEDDNAEIPAYLAGWAASKESRDKSRRLRNASTERAHRGESRNAGPRPFGYADDRLKLNPSEADLLRAAATKIIGGGAASAIVRDWNRADVATTRNKQWTMSAVKAVLTRPRNAGLVVLRGEVVPDLTGKWEPLWDVDQHNNLCAILESKGGGRTPRTALLSGTIRCGCGAPMRISSIGGGNGKVYRCSVQTDGKRSGGVEHFTIGQAAADSKAWKWLLFVLVFGEVEDAETKSLVELYNKRDENRSQVERLIDAVMEGALTAKDVAPRRASLELEAAGIAEKISTFAAANARTALIADVQQSLWVDGARELNIGAASDIIRHRLEELSLEDLALLVRSCLQVQVVTRGKGGPKGVDPSKRIRFTPLVPVKQSVTQERLDELFPKSLLLAPTQPPA